MTAFSPLEKEGFEFPSWLFFCLFCGAGILFAAFTPPYQVADESAHFVRAFDVSRGQLLPWDISVSAPEKLRFGKTAMIRTSLPGWLHHDFGAVSGIVWDNRGFSFVQLAALWKSSPPLSFAEPVPENPVQVNGMLISRYLPAQPYSPVPYLPDVLSIAVCRLFSARALFSFYLARLLSLVCAGIILTVGFNLVCRRFTGREVLLYALAAGMPMNIAQAASCSADALTNALSFLVSVQGLSLCAFAEAETSINANLLFALCGALLGLCKYVYLIIPCVLEIAFWLRAPRVRMREASVCFALIMLPSLLWLLMLPKIPELVSGGQIYYVVLHPLRVWWIFAADMCAQAHFYCYGLVGWFGYFSARLSPSVILLYVLLFAFAAAVYRRKAQISHASAFCAAGMLVAVIFLGMYINWSDFGAYHVNGVQGRYFIPLLPLLLFALPRFVQISEKTMSRLAALSFAVWIFTMAESIFVALRLRYW